MTTYITGTPIGIAAAPTHDDRSILVEAVHAERQSILRSTQVCREVHRRRGTRAPVVGEVVSVWIDGSTPYAMAPRA